MGPLLLGLDRSLPEVLAAAVVLTAFLPWCLCWEMRRPDRGDVWHSLLRVLALLWLADRLTTSPGLWLPLALAAAGAWPCCRAMGATGLLWLGVCWTAAAVSAGGLLPLPAMMPLVALIFVGFYFDLLTRTHQHDVLSQPARRRWTDPALLLAGSAVVGVAPTGLDRGNFIVIIMLSLLGWMAVAFLLHRRKGMPSRFPLLMRAIGSAAWVIVAIGMPALSLEVFFRFFYVKTDSMAHLRVVKHWMNRHVQYNSWGYRDVEYEPLEQFRDHLRAVMIGDSIAFGYGVADVSQTLGPLVEKELSSLLARPVKVINLAVPGSSTSQQTTIYNSDGLRLNPRVVIWAYCMNDVDLPPKDNRHCRLLTWTRELNAASDALEFITWHAAVAWRLPPFRSMYEYAPAYADHAVFEAHKRNVLELKDLIQSHGAEPVVVLFPYCVENPASEDAKRAVEQMLTLFKSEGVAVVNVGDFVDVADPSFYVNPLDPHPDSEVFRRIAPAVAGLVSQRLNLPLTSQPHGG